MLQVNTNIAALSGLRSLSKTAMSQNRSIERLSTGFRINRASDDPSGLVISEKLRSQINGLSQALENTQNNINLVNTAEGALQEISDILVSMRSGVIFAMNSGFSIPEQIDAEQDKIDQSIVAIDRIAQSTRFAKRKLLNGDADFKVEQSTTDRSALDFLQVRQVRLNPSTGSQAFSVNVTQLAERATIISNKAFDSSDQLASLQSGGNAADFVTLRITGSRGSQDINLGPQATMDDFINSVNSNATSLGIYASSVQPLQMESSVYRVDLAGLGAGIQLTNQQIGNGFMFGVEVNGVTTNVIVEDTDAAGSITVAELQSGFDDAFGASIFTVSNSSGDLRIERDDGVGFTLTGAKNVREVRLDASSLVVNDAAGDNDGTDLEAGFDTDGDGASDIALTVTDAGGDQLLTTAGEQAELIQAFVASQGTGAGGDMAMYYDPTTGEYVVLDRAGTFTAGSTLGIVDPGTGDVTTPVTATASNVTHDDGLRLIFGLSSPLAAPTVEMSFVNVNVGSGYINTDGDLEISTSGDDLTLSITDTSGTAQDIAVTPANGSTVLLSDIRSAIQGAAALVDEDQFDVFFSRDKGLTIVNNTGRSFTVSNHSAPAAGDVQLSTVRGVSSSVASVASVPNTRYLALFSLDFGSDQTLKIEDVTSAVSTVQLRSSANNGLRFTTNGAAGLGVFNDDTSSMADLRRSSFLTAGKDVKGTINGLAFGAKGFNVQMVTSTIDLKMRMAETFGREGLIGRQAVQVEYGLADVFGNAAVLARLAGTRLPEGVLESFTFNVLQRIGEGSRGSSGLRFQLRESGSTDDALQLGIRSMTTGSLGLDIDPESANGSSVLRTASLSGGALNTLRTGGGNDLFANPENALTILDAAIDQVSDLRAFLGSISNDTLQRNVNSIGVALENLSSSESAIRDIDFAAETTEFAKQQVLFTAGASVLAQANQIPSQLLRLLQ